jgi:hypothetical protein
MIIHQLRCKGVRFLKKDGKCGNWTLVPLAQCRLKISQRLRERAPFIKLEHMKARTGLTKVIRPITSISAVPSVLSRPVALPLEIITVTDASSDEDDGTECQSVGGDDPSFYGGENASLQSPFDYVFSGFGPLDLPESLFQTEADGYGKRAVDSMATVQYPQRKRPRKISVDHDQDDYATMLLKDSCLLDDISVTSLDPMASQEAMNDLELDDCLDQIIVDDLEMSKNDLAEYLELLF